MFFYNKFNLFNLSSFSMSIVFENDTLNVQNYLCKILLLLFVVLFIFCILNNIFLYEKHALLSTCLVYFTVSKVSKLIDRGLNEFFLLLAFTPKRLLYFST